MKEIMNVAQVSTTMDILETAFDFRLQPGRPAVIARPEELRHWLLVCLRERQSKELDTIRRITAKSATNVDNAMLRELKQSKRTLLRLKAAIRFIAKHSKSVTETLDEMQREGQQREHEVRRRVREQKRRLRRRVRQRARRRLKRRLKRRNQARGIGKTDTNANAVAPAITGLAIAIDLCELTDACLVVGE